jgi:hypothetical protein
MILVVNRPALIRWDSTTTRTHAHTHTNAQSTSEISITHTQQPRRGHCPATYLQLDKRRARAPTSWYYEGLVVCVLWCAGDAVMASFCLKHTIVLCVPHRLPFIHNRLESMRWVRIRSNQIRSDQSRLRSNCIRRHQTRLDDATDTVARLVLLRSNEFRWY